MGRQFMKLPCDILARTDLTLAAKVVYAVLWDAQRGRVCTQLGYGAIATRAGIGRTSVIRAVAELADKTDLQVTHGGQAQGRRNTYRVPLTSADSGLPNGSDSGLVVGPKRTIGRPKPGQELGPNPDTVSERETTTKTKAKRAVWLSGCQAVLDYWNEHRGKPQARTLTAGRQRKLASRLAEPAFAEGWREAIDRLGRAPAGAFVNGGSDRGWRADFDWFIRDSTNYVRLLEDWGQEAPGSKTTEYQDDGKDWGAIARKYDEEQGIVR